eukprot:c12136_g1_i1.p1 GENE.c12136_g1_i1~~c12136_g1_i1.p1  ORF type:complete len:141 (-),score=2.00 c12136_g1_i1:242-664(-)
MSFQSIIDGKEKSSLVFRDVEDDFVISLADYMNKKGSIVDSLVFIDCSLSENGINALLKCDNLRALNMIDCGLFDEDIKNSMFPGKITHIGLRDNYLSADVIHTLHNYGFLSLNIGPQKSLTNDMEKTDESNQIVKSKWL